MPNGSGQPTAQGAEPATAPVAAILESMLAPLLLGFGTGLSLIVAIGAQNAFVLRQGILRQHVLPIVLICGLTDAILEALGVAGIGFLVERAPLVLEVIRWGGVAFLLWYAWGAARRAMQPEALVADVADGSDAGSQSVGSQLKRAVLACLAITYLNPHVYLDTMVLMGSVGNTQGDPARWWFALGGGIASVIWFAVLGYGARALTRFFATPRSWQVLDWIIVVVMLVIAGRLAFEGMAV